MLVFSYQLLSQTSTEMFLLYTFLVTFLLPVSLVNHCRECYCRLNKRTPTTAVGNWVSICIETACCSTAVHRPFIVSLFNIFYCMFAGSHCTLHPCHVSQVGSTKRAQSDGSLCLCRFESFHLMIFTLKSKKFDTKNSKLEEVI